MTQIYTGPIQIELNQIQEMISSENQQTRMNGDHILQGHKEDNTVNMAGETIRFHQHFTNNEISLTPEFEFTGLQNTT